jgi:Tol biopolymer transport system component
MSAIDRFDRDLGSWLEADAPTIVPDGLHDAVIERARRTRQRPRWLAWVRGSGLGAWSLRWPLRTLVVAAVLAVGGSALLLGGALDGRRPPRPAGVDDGLIAFVVPREDYGPTELFMTRPDGSELRSLARVTNGSIAFSPDGRRLAVRRELHTQSVEPGPVALAVLDLSTGAELSADRVPRRSDIIMSRDPRWSPDGRAVLTESWTSGAGAVGWPGWVADTWSLDLETSAWTHLTRFADGPALWSPDGQWLLVPHQGDLFLVPRESLAEEPIREPTAVPGVRRLTDDGGWKYVPSWSPDGTAVMWVTHADGLTPQRDAGGRVEVIDLRTESRSTLVEPGCAPTWAPDGREVGYLVGSRGDPAGYEAWIVGRDGSNRRRLGSSWSGILWSPSGDSVLLDGSTGLLALSNDGSGPISQVSEDGRWYSQSHLGWLTGEPLCIEAEPTSKVAWQPIP